jgi:hypothetical protein
MFEIKVEDLISAYLLNYVQTATKFSRAISRVRWS